MGKEIFKSSFQVLQGKKISTAFIHLMIQTEELFQGTATRRAIIHSLFFVLPLCSQGDQLPIILRAGDHLGHMDKKEWTESP